MMYKEAVALQESLSIVTTNEQHRQSIGLALHGLLSQGALFDARAVALATQCPLANLPSQARHFAVTHYGHKLAAGYFELSWMGIQVATNGGIDCHFPLDGSLSLPEITKRFEQLFPADELGPDAPRTEKHVEEIVLRQIRNRLERNGIGDLI